MRERRDLAVRYWASLLGARHRSSMYPASRGRAGYSLGRRYVAALLGVRLPSRVGRAPLTSDAAQCHAEDKAPTRQILSAIVTRDIEVFALPRMPERAFLAASARPDTVVLDAVMLDGGMFVRVHRRDAARPDYRIEVELAGSHRLPAIVRIWTSSLDQEPSLLIPLAAPRIGPPSSSARLVDFAAGMVLHAASPVEVNTEVVHDPDLVIRSVHAAETEATVRAWRQAALLLPDHVRSLIEGQLP